jgi:hypothetical protein
MADTCGAVGAVEVRNVSSSLWFVDHQQPATAAKKDLPES